MLKKHVLALAILAVASTSGAAFAAQNDNGETKHAIRHHKRIAAPALQEHVQLTTSPGWILPQGWPHTP